MKKEIEPKGFQTYYLLENKTGLEILVKLKTLQNPCYNLKIGNDSYILGNVVDEVQGKVFNRLCFFNKVKEIKETKEIKVTKQDETK